MDIIVTNVLLTLILIQLVRMGHTVCHNQVKAYDNIATQLRYILAELRKD